MRFTAASSACALRSRELRHVALALIGLVVLSACKSTDAVSPETAGIARMRQLTSPYSDLAVATAAGYSVWSPDPTAAGATCPSSAEGNMGYHRVNVALRGGAGDPAAGDAIIDVDKPEMLVYEKSASGAMVLVGVEYLVFKAAWERAKGVGAPAPTILGRPLLLDSHAFPGNAASLEHYELHVWIWKDNPAGMFAPYNSRVTC